LLQQLLADRLSGPEGEAIETHIERCPACQQSLERLTGSTDVRQRQGLLSRSESGSDFLRRLEQEPPAGVSPSPGQRQPATSTNKPGPIPKHLLPGEPTAAEHQDTAPPGRPAGQLQVAPRLGLGPSSSGEVQVLLRKRLRLLALVLSGVCALRLLDWLLGGVGISATFGVFCAGLVLTAGLAGLLWSPRPLSSGQLRVIEVILFGACVAVAVWLHYAFFVPWWAFGKGNPHSAYGYTSLVALSECSSWGFLIMGYGMFIPNTWRRFAAVVGIMAVIPLVLSAASGLTGSALEGRALLNVLTVMGMGLATAAIIAVYGSFRIELLRHEAIAARRLGQYQLKQRLGAGGMGEVYLAEHVLLKRPCAIKVIRPERAGDPRNLARFEREVQATATLTHPNTIEVFDYGHTADGTFYYVMEYLPGLSLEELVKQHGPLPPERVIHLLRQVCGALQEAHTAGLIHRDIKPGNIIVGQRGGLPDVVKLLDFGLVRADGLNPDGQQLTQEGALAGTPAYMSPEQAAGKTDLDARSDLYNLGAVAYFLLTGQPPFVRASAVQTLAAHLGEAVVAPDRHRADVPADLQAVVLRCLEKEPAQRFPSADDLNEALARCRCAGSWTRERAADWWRVRTETEQFDVRRSAEDGPAA
jgi:serine/threonine-protein kinase